MTLTKEIIQNIWNTRDLNTKRSKFGILLDACDQTHPTIIDMKKKLPNASINKIDIMATGLLMSMENLKVLK